jgi:hypothetical protein
MRCPLRQYSNSLNMFLKNKNNSLGVILGNKSLKLIILRLKLIYLEAILRILSYFDTIHLHEINLFN